MLFADLDPGALPTGRPGPPVSGWTHEPAHGTDSREPGFRSLATPRNAVSFGGLAITAAALFWLFGDPQIGWIFLLLVPVKVLLWAAAAAAWVYVSSHRPAATLVAFGLGCALLVTAVLGWPFALRFSMARPELEAIAQRVLVTRTEEAPVRTEWLQADAAWAVDGAVYFQMGVFIDEWGLVYDPDRSTPWSQDESVGPGWYQWMG